MVQLGQYVAVAATSLRRPSAVHPTRRSKDYTFLYVCCCCRHVVCRCCWNARKLGEIQLIRRITCDGRQPCPVQSHTHTHTYTQTHIAWCAWPCSCVRSLAALWRVNFPLLFVPFTIPIKSFIVPTFEYNVFSADICICIGREMERFRTTRESEECEEGICSAECIEPGVATAATAASLRSYKQN